MNQKILDKAIELAKKNGWKHPYHPDVENCYELIFDHDFAKALWGKRTIYAQDADVGNVMEAWEHHLQRMVIANDPLKYLDRNI